MPPIAPWLHTNPTRNGYIRVALFRGPRSLPSLPTRKAKLGQPAIAVSLSIAHARKVVYLFIRVCVYLFPLYRSYDNC